MSGEAEFLKFATDYRKRTDMHWTVGMREAFEVGYDAGCAAQAQKEPNLYMCPKECGCLWRDNHDGTMSLYGPNSKSCPACEIMPLTELIPLKRVTATTAQPEGAEWKPDSMHANAAPFLGNCETPHFLGEPTPDRKALTQIPHYALPQNQCKNWKPVASLPSGEKK